MKRILLMVMRNIIYVPYMWIRLCYHAAHPDKYTDEEHYELFKFIVKRANKSGNLVVKKYGEENIPKEGGFIFYPNHQGMYDLLAIIDACERPLSFVAKKEVSNVPFLKQVNTCAKGYWIDRDDVRQGMKVIMSITQDVKNGKNFVIFPEGTRSKNGNIPGEFKGGSFKAATKAKCPIVPVALIDCFKPFDESSIRQVTVQVHILEPLYYEDYKDMKTVEIAEIVKNRIEAVIAEYEEK